MGCCGSNEQTQQQILNDYEDKILKYKQQIEQFKQSLEGIEQEYDQHQISYPQLEFKQIRNFQIIKDQKSYLLELQKKKNEEFNNDQLGIKNLQKIMNKQKNLIIPAISIKEINELDKIKDLIKKDAIRKKFDYLNNEIQLLQNENQQFQNDLLNRPKQFEQNRKKYDEFQRNIQKQLDEINLTIQQQNQKDKEMIIKLENIKLAIKNQIQNNLNYNNRLDNQPSDFEDYIKYQQKRHQEDEQYLKNEQETFKKCTFQLDNINKELINIYQNKENIPQEIQELIQTIQQQKLQLEQIFRQKENNLKIIYPISQSDSKDQLQEELFKLFDFKEEFEGIQSAFKNIEKDVFKKLQDEIDDIAKQAQQCIKQ